MQREARTSVVLTVYVVHIQGYTAENTIVHIVHERYIRTNFQHDTDGVAAFSERLPQHKYCALLAFCHFLSLSDSQYWTFRLVCHGLP